MSITEWLKSLYGKFDKLYSDIFTAVCADCNDHDCEGYVWLLSEEADMLVESGVAVVELNGNTNFIHSFPEDEGQLRLNVVKPPCVLRDEKRCSIYKIRPLVCRMYPVGIVTHEGQIVLALHEDCEYVRRMEPEQRSEFVANIQSIFSEIPAEAIDEIVESYRKVDAISHLPEGPNQYTLIGPIGNSEERR
jgi:Fe-S-cluster containining protein